MYWCPKHGYFEGACAGCLKEREGRLRRQLSAARAEARHAQSCCAKAEAERDEARRNHANWMRGAV